MTETAAADDILQLELGISPDWHPLPLGADAAGEWAAALSHELLPQGGPVAEMLRFQLARVQQNVSAMDISGLTAAVWLPSPETGYVSSVLGFSLADLLPDDSLDRFLQDFESDRGSVGDTSYLEVETWSGEVPAGPFAAARNLLSHQDDEDIQSWVEERTIFVVLPPGARQCVQIFFSAESIGSFWDMPSQTQAVVATLQVTLGQPA